MATSPDNYNLSKKRRLLKDAGSVKFHVDNNDYFGTAATLISLIEKRLDSEIKKAPANERHLIKKAFRNLRDDLMLLQNNYHIRANKLKSQKTDKGRLKSQ
ncbi:MAG: hypothetical protein PHG95_03350 [Patescibacteria group bacterium]|nr:hypothetical protein [Patescibacteria group bacterium]